MDDLVIRELPQTQVVVFSHKKLDTPRLLRLLASYIEASGATLLHASYTNADPGDEYSENLTATIECPWQS